MLTFALNQLFYFIAYQWTSVTGGEDGMPGVPRPEFLGMDFKDPLVVLRVRFGPLPASLWVMKRIVESPLGRILQAIRENEVRAEAVGYNVPRFKLLAFVIGGAFSRPRGRALRHALRHRAARGDQLRVLRQRGVRHADRRLGLALRADHRLVRLHLAVRVDERGVGALAAAPRRGVRDRGAVLPRRRGRGLDRFWAWRRSSKPAA